MTNQTVENQVYHSMLAEHRELMREIADLRRWWKELDEFGLPKYGEMGTRLKELRDHLRAHFEEEEADGYLAAALAAAPRFTHDAEYLRAQHRQFLDTLDRFTADLQATEPHCCNWEDARRRLEEFLTQLREHEAAENAIAHAAFGEDIGSVD